MRLSYIQHVRTDIVQVEMGVGCGGGGGVDGGGT